MFKDEDQNEQKVKNTGWKIDWDWRKFLKRNYWCPQGEKRTYSFHETRIGCNKHRTFRSQKSCIEILKYDSSL